MDHRIDKGLPTVSGGGDSQRRRRTTHSFSSSLLDAICQSMELDEHGDEAQDGGATVLNSHQHLKVKISKQQQRTKPSNIVVLQAASFRQETVNVEKKPMHHHRHATSSSSSSIISNLSCSDSSSLGQNSTSGSSYGVGSGYSSSSCFSTCSKKSRKECMKEKLDRAKLRAISFCSELKRARTNPVSPRLRLTSYLNTLFNAKKHSSKTSSPNPAAAVPKQEAYPGNRKPKKTTSAANLSSSQLIKPLCPPPSTSIVSVSRTIYGDKPGREVFRRCQEKIVRGLKMREFIEEDYDDDDDAESYASSDLFELETLLVGGGGGEELPVFETTDIKTNQAIANRFSM